MFKSLHAKQLYEILNQDRFINQKVAEINKKAVERYDSDLAPVPANDKEVLGGIDTLVDKLNAILYNKVSLLQSVPDNIDRFLDLYDYKGIISTFIDINKIDDVLILYNSIVKQYLVPSTMTNVSKSLIRNKLASTLTNLTNVYDKIERIVIIYIKQFNVLPKLDETDPQGVGGTKTLRLMNIGRVISRCLSTFSIYRIIKEQIQADKYHIVDISDFEHEVKRLSDKNPEIRKFLEKFKELDPRLHSRKYVNNFEDSEEFEKLFNEALRKLRSRIRGEPSERAKNLLKAKIKAEYLESFSKGKLKAENAYVAELGREMTPDERRNLLNMNRADMPQEAIRIIQPPPYFDDAEERIRATERMERFRRIREGIRTFARETDARRREQRIRDEREAERQQRDREAQDRDMDAVNVNWDDFFF
jgi:hypothetical protein